MTAAFAFCLLLASPPAPDVEPTPTTGLPRYDAGEREAASPAAAPTKRASRRSVAVGATLLSFGALALVGGIILPVLANSDADLCTQMPSCSFGCYRSEGRCTDFPLRMGYMAGGVTLLLSSVGFVAGGSATLVDGKRRANLAVAPTGIVLRF
jgi:hypothetical protein